MEINGALTRVESGVVTGFTWETECTFADDGNP